MHRYIARAIACGTLALAFSLLPILMPRLGSKVISVRTDAQTADIVAAVEALQRKDISIKVAQDPWGSNRAGSVVLGTLGLAGFLWIACSVVRRMETKIAGGSGEK